jgi:uncharacterized repeat protein (TIGR03803 family)
MFWSRWRQIRSVFSPRQWSGWRRRAGQGGPRQRRSVALGVLQFETRETPSTFSTLATFNGTNGYRPRSPLLASNGSFYGTTLEGGANNVGTIFKMPKAGGTITTLATFNTTNGADPAGPLLMDSSGNLYGTCRDGGANGLGTVFELAKGSSTITTLATFDGTNGSGPRSGVVMDSQGNLYGTAHDGGANGVGTVFEVVKGSGTITTLVTFNNTNGANPYSGLLLDGSGNLYGTTFMGGPSGVGTVFEVSQGSNALTTLASFNGSNGAYPYNVGGLLLDGQGNLYGTTYGSVLTGPPTGAGNVFEVVKGSGTVTSLASFGAANGSVGGVLMDGQGNLFGTTFWGGSSNDGTVFELAKGSSTLTTLVSFTGSNGQWPYVGLVMDGKGNLFGTTFLGGASGDGTVFEVSGAASPSGPGAGAAFAPPGNPGASGLAEAPPLPAGPTTPLPGNAGATNLPAVAPGLPRARTGLGRGSPRAAPSGETSPLAATGELELAGGTVGGSQGTGVGIHARPARGG